MPDAAARSRAKRLAYKEQLDFASRRLRRHHLPATGTGAASVFAANRFDVQNSLPDAATSTTEKHPATVVVNSIVSPTSSAERSSSYVRTAANAASLGASAWL
jgi:hypothetical protein